MNRPKHSLAVKLRRTVPVLLAAPLTAMALSPAVTLSNYPLFLVPPVKPNLMIILDSSQSMDATMEGMVIDGDDVRTRGNVARTVLRSLLDSYRDSFNWGLTAFEAGGPSLYTTYAYYMGGPATMRFTNDCVGGVSASNGGLRCIPNPEATNPSTHITYEKTGDDPSINDVLYTNNQGPQLYAVGVPASFDSYDVYRRRANATANWTTGDFNSPYFSGSFGATDAGFTPEVASYPRQVFVRRGWGYYDNPSGNGRIRETVQADSNVHFANLKTLLANEDRNTNTEIKNNSVFTPLAGSLRTVKEYFASASTPITSTCQKNFVVLATDGNPTADLNGTKYNLVDTINTETLPGSKIWNYGLAQQDVFTQLTALRTTTVAAKNYDVQTYIVGMGKSVINAGSVAGLNKMADLGGGFGTAFLGDDTAALTAAFKSVVVDIQSKTSAAASIALNSGSLGSDTRLYQAKFDPSDWTGNLVAYPVDANGTVVVAPTWEARDKMKAQNWDTQRKILTYKPSAALGARGVPFRWPAIPATPTATEIDTLQATALQLNSTAVNDGFGSLRLEYLRGDVSRERANCPACADPQFRNRQTPLGDIVNSSPFYVGAPNFGYYDDIEAVAYSSFVATYRTRTPVIYVGANDGMLHAFNAATGAELFAYVPSAVFSELSKLTDRSYSHRYYVDGPPVVGDVFYAGAWHSLLVSGFRAGAKGLFALDVTNPTSFSEANAANIVRWEFQDSDMGYVVGQPLLVKTNNGRWSVVVNGGYGAGNASGHAFLFVIDAETGVLVKKIDTGVGTAASPNGLSAVAAIDTNNDSVADAAYAGDLDGNLWRFNLKAVSPASWGLGNGGLKLFATAGQSITGRPDVTRYRGGAGYLVGFGSGRYLSTADPSVTATQTQYGVRDTECDCTVALSSLVQQSVVDTVAVGARKYRRTTHRVGLASDAALAGDTPTVTRASYDSTYKGWFMNLPTAGERSVGTPNFRGGRVIFNTIIPDVTTNVCVAAGSGWLMELDALTGNRFDTETFDTNGDGKVDDTDKVAGNVPSGASVDDGIGTDPTFMGGGATNRKLEFKEQNKSNGVIQTTAEAAVNSGPQRVMWREVK